MTETGLYLGVYNPSLGRIDWLARYQFTDFLSLSVTEGLGPTSDSLSALMRFPVGAVSELPLSGQIIRVVIGGVKVFEGVIGQVSNRWLTGGHSIEIEFSTASYVHLLNRHLVSIQRAPSERAGARIRRILAEFAGDFASDFSFIAEGPVIPEESYDYQTVSSIISNIASQTGFLWSVDFDRRVHFFADLDQPAPIGAIDADSELQVGDLVITSDALGIANVIYLKDYASRSRNRHSHVQTADGETSFFSLPLPPFTLEDTEVYVKPEASDSWVQRLVLPDPLDGRSESVAGVPGVAYLCTFNWGVRFPTSDMPGPGDRIRVDYNPELPDRVTVVMDEDSVRECARREGGDGRHELVVSLSDYRVADDTPIEALGEMLLRRKAWPVVTGSFTVRTTNYRSWRPGQTFTVYSAKRDVFDVRAWVLSEYTQKLPLRVWVSSVSRSFEVGPGGIRERSTVNFTSNPWEEL